MISKLEQSVLDEQKQLDELTNKPEDKPSETIVDEVIDDSGKEKAEEVKEPEKEGDNKPAETDEERQKRENDLKAQERIAKREARKKLELENERLKGYVAAKQEQEAAAKPKAEEIKDPEPDKDLDPDAHLRWELRRERAERLKDRQEIEQMKLDRQFEQGKQEVRAFEDIYKKQDPEYDNAKQFLIGKVEEQLRAQQPGISEVQIRKQIDYLEVQNAANALKLGVTNPALYFKMKAMDAGWQPKPVIKDNPKEEVKPKIDLKTIEMNKKKTVNLMGGSSRGRVGDPTAQEMADMTIAELSKLDEGAWKRI